MRRLIVVALLLLAVTACEPTGHRYCDQWLAPRAYADDMGYTFKCGPALPGAPVNVSGWIDVENRVLHVWPARLSGLPDVPRAVNKVMWHELGHARHYQLRGTTGTELWADSYAYCHINSTLRAGIGFLAPHPTDCRPFR